MQLKSLEVGKLHIKNNLFLAPLAGYTNAVFRQMCTKLGAGLTFTEMVSAKGLCYNSENTKSLLFLPDDYEGVKAVQLFGADPEFMKRAANSEEIAPFDLIDINMGCPMPKIYKNGEGSALLENIPLAQAVVRAAKSSGKEVSIKFRIGIDEEHLITRDFAVAMEDAGADIITIHGRTRDKIYSGGVNFDEIAKAKLAVKIPVIANGGVFERCDAEKLLNNTGADGVMVARGAMYDPFIFARITDTPVEHKKQIIKRQLDKTYLYYDSRFATVYMRKMIAFYLKGQPNSTQTRVKLMSCNTKEEIENILEDSFN